MDWGLNTVLLGGFASALSTPSVFPMEGSTQRDWWVVFQLVQRWQSLYKANKIMMRPHLYRRVWTWCFLKRFRVRGKRIGGFCSCQPSFLRMLEDRASDFSLGAGRRTQSRGEPSLLGDRWGLRDLYVRSTSAWRVARFLGHVERAT